MTVLEIVRSVCGVIGLPQPSSLTGTTDLQVIQLRELLNTEGTELEKRSSTGWEALIAEATFTTVATEDQGALTTIIGASNAYRSILNETIWNRTDGTPIYGPRAPHTWQGYKAIDFAGPYPEYRIRGGHLWLLPVPTAGQTCAFEYVTRNWLQTSGGTPLSVIAADTDVPLLDESLLKKGLEWRWRKAKGLDYSQDFDDYERAVVDALARDGTKARKDLAGCTIESDIPVAIPRLIGS
jgi:hypothetical protein